MGKAITAAGALLLCTGCATAEWPTPQEEVAVWLTEQPRVLALDVDPVLPTPFVQVRDHKAGERVGRGALGAVKGAGLSVAAGCLGMGPFGCLVGVVAAPVFAVGGAVVGAVSVDSVDVPHNLIEAQGAPELYRLAVNGPALQALFGETLLAESAKRSDEGPRLVRESDSGAKVHFHFNAFDLYGAVGEDPSVALRIKFSANVATPDATAHRYIDLTYQGWSRPISEWKAQGAKLFREELVNAANAIAQKALEQLRTQPPSGAAAKVAHARERRREAAAPAPAAPAIAEPVHQFRPQPVGATWEYALQDRIFTRRKHTFSVRAEAMEGGIVVESFEGEGGIRGIERVDSGAFAFSARRLPAGELLVELGPYVRDASVLDHTPSGYPLYDSFEGWRISSSAAVAEVVSVPAGTYKALRMEVTGERSPGGFISHSNSMWNVIGVARFRYTAWYVPQVGRYVMARHEQWSFSGNQTADEVVELLAYRAP